MKNYMLLVLLFTVLFGFFALPEAEAMPIAFGQFHAGDWAMGLLFSFLETADIGATIGVAAYEGSTMMHGGVPIRDWDSTGQVVFFSALGSFVLTKFVDAFTAAMTADAYNKKQTAGKVSFVVRDREVGLSFGYRY